MVESPRIPSSDTMKTLSETRTHHSRTLALSYLLPAIRQNSMLQLTTEKLHLSFMLSSIRLRSRSCLFPDQPTRTCSQLFDQIQKVKVVDYKSKFYYLWLKRSLIRSMLLFLIGQGEDSFFCCSLASIRGLLSAFCLALHANDGSLHALSFHIQKIFFDKFTVHTYFCNENIPFQVYFQCAGNLRAVMKLKTSDDEGQ